MLIYEPKEEVKRNSLTLEGVHTFTITNPNGSIKRQFTKHNMVVDVGLNMVAQILANLVPPTQGINYCGFGTGTASITAGDTQMEAEGVRKIKGTSQVSGNQFIVAFYLNQAEGNGTWTRYGTFIDGDADPNSGKLFSHVDIDLTKNEGEGLTVNSQYSLYWTEDAPV